MLGPMMIGGKLWTSSQDHAMRSHLFSNEYHDFCRSSKHMYCGG